MYLCGKGRDPAQAFLCSLFRSVEHYCLSFPDSCSERDSGDHPEDYRDHEKDGEDLPAAHQSDEQSKRLKR